MYRLPWLLLPLTLGGSAAPIDADHDTYPAGIDCDDGDVHAHPHAPERANGRDVTFADGRKMFLGSSGTGAPRDGRDPTEPPVKKP